MKSGRPSAFDRLAQLAQEALVAGEIKAMDITVAASPEIPSTLVITSRPTAQDGSAPIEHQNDELVLRREVYDLMLRLIEQANANGDPMPVVYRIGYRLEGGDIYEARLIMNRRNGKGCVTMSDVLDGKLEYEYAEDLKALEERYESHRKELEDDFLRKLRPIEERDASS